MSLRKNVASNIREMAERKGKQITSIPDFAGVNRAHFFAFLSGKQDVTLGWLEKIAIALEVEPEELVRRISQEESDRNDAG